MGLSYLCQILLSQERYYLIRLLSTHFTRALLLDTFTQHPFHMAVIEMRLTTLLLLLLVSFLSFHRYFSKRHTGSVIIVDNYFGLS